MEGKRDVLAECKAKLETTLKVLTTTLCLESQGFSLQFDEGSILLHAPCGCHQLLYSASCLQSRLPGGIPFQALFFFFFICFLFSLFSSSFFFISSFPFLLQGVTTFFWVNLLCYLKARTNLYTTHIEITKL